MVELVACLAPLVLAVQPDRPQYICLNDNQGWRTDNPASFTQASVDAVLAAVNGTRGSADGRARLCLSFDFWIFYAGDVPTMVKSAEALVALAEANDMPLSVSIDATQWWSTRPDLWNWWNASAPGYDPVNRLNVEWTGWDASRDATALSWRNWGSQFRMPTPAPNYAAPAFRKAAAETMAPIAAVFARWYAGLPAGKKHLLAYVRCTQELWEGTNYFVYPNSTLPSGPNPAWRNTSADPTAGLKDSVQIGYAALCIGPSKQCSGAVTTSALDTMVQQFVGFAGGVLADAGLPRSRIMSHTGAFWFGPPHGLGGGPGPPYPPAAWDVAPSKLAWNSPIAAVTNAAAPGWSVYGSAEDDPSAALGLGAALDAVEGTPWGAPEWLRTFDNTGSAALWAGAFNATMRYRNNRLIVVQNFGSIQHNPGALAALGSTLRAAPLRECFVDAATGLAATGPNATAWRLSWTTGGADTASQIVDVAAAAAPLEPSGRPKDRLASMPLGAAVGQVVWAPPHGVPPPFCFSVASFGCGSLPAAGAQATVSDVVCFGKSK